MKTLNVTRSLTTVVVTEAIQLCDWLADWLTLPDLSTLDQVDEQFELLGTVIEALPPTVADRSLMAYLRNRLGSTKALREAGEYRVAVYQLGEMSRKLCRAAEMLAKD